MISLTDIGIRAKKASRYMARLGINERNKALAEVAKALIDNADYIKEANNIDLENAKANNMKPALIDRLTLTDDRIKGMEKKSGGDLTIDGKTDIITISYWFGKVFWLQDRFN